MLKFIKRLFQSKVEAKPEPNPEPKVEPFWITKQGPWEKNKACHCGKHFVHSISLTPPELQVSFWTGVCPDCGCEDEPKIVKGRWEWEWWANWHQCNPPRFIFGAMFDVPPPSNAERTRNERWVEWTECAKGDAA